MVAESVRNEGKEDDAESAGDSNDEPPHRDGTASVAQ